MKALNIYLSIHEIIFVYIYTNLHIQTVWPITLRKL